MSTRTLRIGGVVAGAIVLAACLPAKTDASRVRRIETLISASNIGLPSVPQIEARDLLAMTKPTLLVDVRPEEERAVSILAGAIPVESLPDTPTNQVIVVYCTIGVRSAVATKSLRELGWDAHNLRGGLLLYTHADGALVDSRGPTKRVHTYNSSYALVKTGYESVW